MKKTILVTGGNRGIGLEICRQLARLGHRVLLGSRDLESGKAAAIDINGEIHIIQLDVTRAEDIFNLSNEIETKFDKLDVLINNAGIGVGSGGAVTVDLDDVKKIMEVNFYGAWQLSQAMIPFLKKSNDGRIINMSSGMGALDDLVGGYAGYRLSKTALNGLTILMANELKGSIKVNAMDPGWVRTDMGGDGAPRSVQQGADTAVWLALEEDIPTGKSFRDRKVILW